MNPKDGLIKSYHPGGGFSEENLCFSTDVMSPKGKLDHQGFEFGLLRSQPPAYRGRKGQINYRKVFRPYCHFNS